ncbi:hypothetical protein BIY27_02845 [Gibbsiella quercinecans]|nr:hypothetical protein BIY27_02845 [Gibbsiella quercinecans]
MLSNVKTDGLYGERIIPVILRIIVRSKKLLKPRAVLRKIKRVRSSSMVKMEKSVSVILMEKIPFRQRANRLSIPNQSPLY